MLTKGAIYYTDNRARWFILYACQEQIKKAWSGKLISVSLKPINFGKNIVLEGRTRSYPTQLTQIIMALEALDTDIVFFLEHDVLYHPTHFDFIPSQEDIYYYDTNIWRWGVNEDFATNYDNLTSLSMLCCFRKTALAHFKNRLKYVNDNGWDINRAREPRNGQVISYEPGTKPISHGGFSDEKFGLWRSEFSNIDIRHRHTFSSPKYHKEDFSQIPVGFREEKIENIPYWNLKELHDMWWVKYQRELTQW